MPNTISLDLGKKIREYRMMRNLTQQKLAELSDIEYKYLQRIEGKNPPSIGIETLGKIAKALKIEPHKFLKYK